MRAARCGRCVVMKWRERISAPAVALSSFWQLLFWFWVCLFFCSLPFFLFWPDQTVVTCFTLPPSSQLRRQPSALVTFFPLFVILCFDYNCNSPPHLPLLLTSLPTPDPHPLLPCSPLFHQIATAWANVHVTALPWDRRWLHCECEEKRKEGDCFQIAQAPKKRHFFHFLPGLREGKKNRKEKKCKTEVKSAEDGAEGEIVAGRSAKKWNCFLEGKSGGEPA